MLYDVISLHMFILSKNAITFLRYENRDRMSYLRTLYGHFENFRKIKFQGERIFEKPLAFCEFSPDFLSESGFALTKDRRVEIRGSLQSIEKNVLTPLPTNDFLKQETQISCHLQK